MIGTKFGAGDGSTTFNVPDFRGRHLEGASAVNAVGTHLEAGLPNITGNISNMASDGSNFTKCFSGSLVRSSNDEGTTGNFKYYSVSMNASNGETKTDGTLKTSDEHHVYGSSDTVQPDSVCVNYIIKY